MFYLRILGLIFLVLSTTMVGFEKSEKLRYRKDFLRDFLDFLSNLDTNIRFCCDDIFLLLCKSANHKFNFECLSQASIEEFWDGFVSYIPKSYGLTCEDYTLLRDFGCNLGSTDVSGQCNHISLYFQLFSKQLSKAEQDYKNKSKLYKILGFFGGTVIALMII